MYIWEKDPNYWNAKKLDPKPNYVVYRTAPSADAEIQQFKDGACDTTGAANSYTLVKAAIDSGYQYAEITDIIDPCPRAIWMNCDPSRAPMNDPRMRQAISALVDREKIAHEHLAGEDHPRRVPVAGLSRQRQVEQRQRSQ